MSDPANELIVNAEVSIAVCIACFNRRDTTLDCLSSLFSAHVPQGYKLAVYLVDDGSADGTAEAVAASFPQVRIFRERGDRYWGGAMRIAFEAAMRDRHNFYLWLNDDVSVQVDAIQNTLKLYEKLRGENRSAILVGATCDDQGVTTYSGMSRSGRHPLGFSKIEPNVLHPVPCDTANGNFLFIPHGVASLVGNIDRCFQHRMGDLDYCLRARSLNVECWIIPNHVGRCAPNLNNAKWQSGEESFSARWAHLNSPLGLPPKQWIRFGWRHGGFIGILAALAHYHRIFRGGAIP